MKVLKLKNTYPEITLELILPCKDQTKGWRSPEIEKYNKKQRRKDRKIDTTAAEYFSEQKKLDIANEMIFQLGDKEFWDNWREDEVFITRKGKEIILKRNE